MAVAYDDRDIPLNADAGNALTTGLQLAYDFTGVDSRGEGEAYEALAGTPTLVKTGTISQVTFNSLPGRQASATSLYEYTNTTDYGLQVGTGDWTIAVLFSTGSSLPVNNNTLTLFQVRNASGTVLATINAVEFASTGWYFTATGTQGLGGSAGATYYGTDKTLVFFLTRRSGIVSGWTMEATPAATLTRRFNDGASNSTDWDNASATRIRVLYNISAAAINVAGSGVKFWAAGLTDDQMRDVGRDWFALDENTVAADEIAITSPASSATIPTTTTISGTYTYNSGAPSSIEVQQGSGSWVALTSFSAAGGTWSGSITLSAGSSQTIRARDAVATTIISPDVTGLTIEADAISFTAQNYGTYTNMQAVAHRMFQRDGSNQAVGVRIVGEYDGGPPTAIEWRYNGGSWATLDAAPTGGVFDETVTLQGPAQGSLEVRFSNNTAVNASLPNVGVGDVYLCMGQSNHVGAAGSYVPPVAPGAHPGWVPTKFGKNHVWAPIAETSGDKFDDETPVYAAFSVGSPLGSYFGALGTLIMDTGVPVAFVPCAKGSTSIDNWAVGSPVTDTATLFGAAASTALLIGAHAAVLWQQGEAEGAGVGDASLLADKLDVIIDQWTTTVGTPWYVNIPPFAAMGSDADATTVRAELASMPGLNAAVLAAIDLDGDYTGIHYDTPTDINNVAASVFAALPYTSSYTLTADAGTYSLTGNEATLTGPSGFTLTAEAGMYSINGLETDLQYSGQPFFARGGRPKKRIIIVRKKYDDPFGDTTL